MANQFLRCYFAETFMYLSNSVPKMRFQTIISAKNLLLCWWGTWQTPVWCPVVCVYGEQGHLLRWNKVPPWATSFLPEGLSSASPSSYKVPSAGVASQVALVVKNLPAKAGHVRDTGSVPGSGRSPGVGMATHSSIPAWRILWTEKPWGLQSMGSHGVGHDWSNLAQTPAS